MLQVMVDNTELKLEVSNMRTMAELIEYIKSSIDPDLVILSLTKDEEPLNDNDWVAPISALGNSKVEVTTGSKFELIQDRLKMVDPILNELISNINEISKLYKFNMEEKAHEPFGRSLSDLNAFVNWILSIMTIDEEIFKEDIVEYHKLVNGLKSICVDIQTQQMQSNWHQLGDILDLKLVSLLEEIRELTNKSIKKVST